MSVTTAEGGGTGKQNVQGGRGEGQKFPRSDRGESREGRTPEMDYPSSGTQVMHQIIKTPFSDITKLSRKFAGEIFDVSLWHHTVLNTRGYQGIKKN